MNINIINSILFHPRKTKQEIGKKDKLIEVEKNVKIGVRYHLKSQSLPTILFFHGNAEIVTEYDDIAHVYNQKNINFIIADYRGYGFSNGMPNAANTQSDAHLILDNVLIDLKNNNFDKPLFLMGRSLGSVSVLELSKRYPKDFIGLIIESGFADEDPLFKLIGTTSDKINFSKKDGFLNGEKIKNYEGALLIIHAEKDHIIPFNQAELLYNNCPSKNKTLVSVPNANHNNILNVSFKIYFNEINIFIKKYLK